MIRNCRASPRCAIYAQAGRGADHRLGSLPVCDESGLTIPAGVSEQPVESHMDL